MSIVTLNLCASASRHIAPRWPAIVSRILLLCLLAISAQAGVGAWTQGNGLYAGSIMAFTADSGGNIYAATDQGIFKSNNNGTLWTVTGDSPLSNYSPNCLSVAPGGQLYAGYPNEGVYKSVDGGQHWQAVNTGLTGGGLYIHALTIDAKGDIYAGTAGGLYKSRDGGTSWVAQDIDLQGDYFGLKYVAAVAIDAKGSVYAGTRQGVFRSDDAGASWQAVNNGLNDNTGMTSYIGNLVAAPNGNLYAATGEGVAESHDGGNSWMAHSLDLPGISTMAAATDGTIYVATYGGKLFKRLAADGSWAAIDTGVSTGIYALASTSNGAVLLGAYTQGVRKSNVDGSWSAANNGLTGKRIAISSVVIDAEGTLYAGSAGHGILQSNDNGQTWVASGLDNMSAGSLVIARDGSLFASAGGAGVFKRSNKNGPWLSLGPASVLVGPIAIAPDDSLYAATFGKGVFRSRDGGHNWLAVNSGLSNLYITALTVDLRGNVYVGTYGYVPDNGISDTFPVAIPGGIFKLSNGGNSWAALNSGLSIVGSGVSSFASDTNGTIYAGFFGKSIANLFKNSNGIDWQAGSLPGTLVTALTFGKDGSLYAGTVNGTERRVLKSADGGSTWTPVGDLTQHSVAALAIAENGDLYAGTEAGIFQYSPPPAKPAQYQISGSAGGGNAALQLLAHIQVASADGGKTGNLYIIAILADGSAFYFANDNWVGVSTAPILPYKTTLLGNHTFRVLDGQRDASALKGTVIYAGYGMDVNDMLAGGKYAAIYNIQ